MSHVNFCQIQYTCLHYSKTANFGSILNLVSWVPVCKLLKDLDQLNTKKRNAQWHRMKHYFRHFFPVRRLPRWTQHGSSQTDEARGGPGQLRSQGHGEKETGRLWKRRLCSRQRGRVFQAALWCQDARVHHVSGHKAKILWLEEHEKLLWQILHCRSTGSRDFEEVFANAGGDFAGMFSYLFLFA